MAVEKLYHRAFEEVLRLFKIRGNHDSLMRESLAYLNRHSRQPRE